MDLWPPDPWSWSFHPLSVDHLFKFAGKSVHLFSIYLVDKCDNGRVNEQMGVGEWPSRKRYASAILDWKWHKTNQRNSSWSIQWSIAMGLWKQLFQAVIFNIASRPSAPCCCNMKRKSVFSAHNDAVLCISKFILYAASKFVPGGCIVLSHMIISDRGTIVEASRNVSGDY